MSTAFSRPRRRLAAAGFAAMLAACAGQALADAAWPSKPIRWINPYSAGGGTDQSSRIIAEKLAVALGQPIVVDNKPGGNTIIGAAAAASSPADGYTVFYAALSTMSVIPSLYERLPYAPDALVPVAQVVRFPLFLMVQDKGSLDTMDKFLAAARTQPLAFARHPLRDCIELCTLGGTMGTVAIGAEVTAHCLPAPCIVIAGAFDAGCDPATGIGSGPGIDIDTVPAIEDCLADDRTAGGVAVLQGQRPAQHLDAIERTQRKARRLALAIECGGRNAVDDQLDPADAEGRARTEAAALHLQVLSVVLAIEHGDARRPHQRPRQRNLALPGAQRVPVDDGDRAGKVGQFMARAEHLDRIQRRGRRRRLLRHRRGEGEQAGHGDGRRRAGPA